MTPTSPIAGLLTGLLDGTVVALVVLAVVFLLGHRRQPARVRVRLDEPHPDRGTDGDRPVDLHRAA